MADLIDREELKKAVDTWDRFYYVPLQGLKRGSNDDYTALVRINDILHCIDTMPAADVQPVKHGYWIKQPEKFQIYEDVINSNYLYSCSCCNASDLHSERANNDGEVKFCWRCGAKMDAEPDEPWQSE